MALVNEQKLEVVKLAFIKKIQNISTWAEFVTLVSNMTKTNVIAFIKNAIDEYALEQSTKATDLADFSDELDNI